MNWKKGLLFSCLLTIVRSMYINIDRKKNFCGKDIATELSKYCKMYTGSEDNHRSGQAVEEGQVVVFCCEKACSTRDLLENFCKTIKPEYKYLFESKNAIQERTNTIVSEKSKEEEGGESREISIAPKKVVSKRPSRCDSRRDANRKVRRVGESPDSPSSPSPSPSSSSKSKSKNKANRCRCCRRLQKKKLFEQTNVHQRTYRAPIVGFDVNPSNQVIYVNKPNV